MAARQATNSITEQFTPTLLQSAMGDALRSEQRTGELSPVARAKTPVFQAWG